MQLGRLEVTIKGLFLALGVAGLVSCGSGDESGTAVACGGADNNGVCLFVQEHQVSDVDAGPDVDVIQVICDPGPPPDIETFVIARTEVTFGASQIGAVPPSTSLITVTGYSISYRAIPPLPPFAAPAIPAVTFTGNLATIPVNGTATANVDLFTIDQKSFYVFEASLLPGNGGGIPPSVTYEAVYTFTGEDEFGESVDVAMPVFFDLANFDNC